jgi:hypothetical protein
VPTDSALHSRFVTLHDLAGLREGKKLARPVDYAYGYQEENQEEADEVEENCGQDSRADEEDG